MFMRLKPLAAAISIGLASMSAGCGLSSDEHAWASPAAEETATARSAQAACDLTGTWATRSVVPVSWPATLGIQAGAGAVVQYIKNARAQRGTSLTDTFQVCGITSPDYRSRPIFGGELYGVRFPGSLFDASALATSTTTGTLSAAETGATYSIPDVLVLLGLTMSSPLTDPWPAEAADVDATIGPNDKPGIEVLAATDPGYSFPPVNLIRTKRASAFQVAIRNVGSSTGTVDTCDRLTGTATVAVIDGKAALDNHIIGCTRTDGAECEPREYELADALNPVFTPTGLGSVVSLRVGADATCADVRAASY